MKISNICYLCKCDMCKLSQRWALFQKKTSNVAVGLKNFNFELKLQKNQWNKKNRIFLRVRKEWYSLQISNKI